MNMENQPQPPITQIPVISLRAESTVREEEWTITDGETCEVHDGSGKLIPCMAWLARPIAEGYRDAHNASLQRLEEKETAGRAWEEDDAEGFKKWVGNPASDAYADSTFYGKLKFAWFAALKFEREKEAAGRNTNVLQMACKEVAALLFPRPWGPQIPLEATRQNAEQVIRQTVESFTQPIIDFAEWGWTIIANASGGDWEKESKEWQEAAVRYRDEFHEKIRHYTPSVVVLATMSSDASSKPKESLSDTNILKAELIKEVAEQDCIYAYAKPCDSPDCWPCGATKLLSLHSNENLPGEKARDSDRWCGCTSQNRDLNCKIHGDSGERGGQA